MYICNNGKNSKPPMYASLQYVTMVTRLRDFVAWHSTWQIRSRHCKGSSLSSLIIDLWAQRLVLIVRSNHGKCVMTDPVLVHRHLK